MRKSISLIVLVTKRGKSAAFYLRVIMLTRDNQSMKISHRIIIRSRIAWISILLNFNRTDEENPLTSQHSVVDD